jgi:hypothetical protein
MPDRRPRPDDRDDLQNDVVILKVVNLYISVPRHTIKCVGVDMDHRHSDRRPLNFSRVNPPPYEIRFSNGIQLRVDHVREDEADQSKVGRNCHNESRIVSESSISNIMFGKLPVFLFCIIQFPSDITRLALNRYQRYP